MFSKSSLFIALVIVVTSFAGLVYLINQQQIRTSANSPQTQLAEELAARLSAGETAQTLVPTTVVDISTSELPFTIIYDQNGKILGSNGSLLGSIPELPRGVFAYVDQYGEDRITWEPISGVRNATVITKFTGKQTGYVLVARSLREAERAQEALLIVVGLTWVFTSVGVFISLFFLEDLFKKVKRALS